MANKPGKWSRCAAAELKRSGARCPHPTQSSGPEPRVAVLQSAKGERAVREQSLSIQEAWCTCAALGAGTTCMGWAGHSHERIPETFQLQPMQTPR